jgi:inositol oxygenase
MENKKLRSYEEGTRQYYLYKEMHEKQTYEYVQSKLKEYTKFNKGEYHVADVLEEMDNFIDPSDPDMDLPNSIHAYQTAERIRKKHPLGYEFQICGLIHDIGKILFKFGEPSWAVVGDTFVTGCAYPKSIVYYDTLKGNPDFNDKRYNTEYGVYEKNCGLDNLAISFGHDEYLYRVLKHNKDLGMHNMDDKYLNMIRFHSFYPWHNEGEYKHLLNEEEDNEILLDVLDLNQYDLYSKEDTDFVLTDEIKSYYSNLLSIYFPKKLLW